MDAVQAAAPDTGLAPVPCPEALPGGTCWEYGSRSLASRPRRAPQSGGAFPDHPTHGISSPCACWTPARASTVWKPSPRLLYTSPRNLEHLQNQAARHPCPPLLASSLSIPDPCPVLLVRWAWRPAAGEGLPPASVLGRPQGSLAVFAGGCPRRVPSIPLAQASQALVPLIGLVQRTLIRALAVLFPAWNSKPGGGRASPYETKWSRQREKQYLGCSGHSRAPEKEGRE